MRDSGDDPRCPECGEPIGQTASYCMHCSADLSAERAAADIDGDGTWDQSEASVGSRDASSRTIGSNSAGKSRWSVRSADGSATSADDSASPEGDQLLAPDGLLDDTLTVAVGIVAGLLVGVVGTIVLALVTGSGWAYLFGVVAWLASTAYLVRRRTVQGAVAHGGYALAIVLLLVPVVALSPALPVDGGLADRGGLFLVLLLLVGVPAGIAATIGWVASRFVPENGDQSVG